MPSCRRTVVLWYHGHRDPWGLSAAGPCAPVCRSGDIYGAAPGRVAGEENALHTVAVAWITTFRSVGDVGRGRPRLLMVERAVLAARRGDMLSSLVEGDGRAVGISGRAVATLPALVRADEVHQGGARADPPRTCARRVCSVSVRNCGGLST